MNDSAEGPSRTRLRAYHLLALVPAIGMLGGVPFANRVHASVFGLPFLLFWILAWVIVTSACMALLNRLDRRQHRP
jgi:Protein of unknown function (DUF3311)